MPKKSKIKSVTANDKFTYFFGQKSSLGQLNFWRKTGKGFEMRSLMASAAQHREIPKIKSKGGLDNRKANCTSKDKQPKESSVIIFQCKVCKNSFQTSNDLNEHWELELYCKSCEKCIQGFYEGQSEHCLPDDEEHTTHEWQKVNNKCTKCVYVAKNNTGLQNHMKNKHDT